MSLNLENPKLFTLDEAVSWRNDLKANGRKLVLTNGCFDLLHTGHLFFLKKAAEQADALMVALNGDKSVQALKGPTRPVQSEEERAYLLGFLSFIDAVIVFHTPRLTAEIEAIQPDVYVKAGDYTRESLNTEELAALDKGEVDIRFLPFLDGYSTTQLIAKISNAAQTF